MSSQNVSYSDEEFRSAASGSSTSHHGDIEDFDEHTWNSSTTDNEIDFGQSPLSESQIGYCVLCWSANRPVVAMFHSSPNCKHAACRGCMKNYLKRQIDDGQYTFQCPACPQQLDQDDVRMLLGRDEVDLQNIEKNRLKNQLHKDASLAPGLFEACQTGNLQRVVALIAEGADFEAVNSNNGWTPLFFASGYGNFEVVDFLINQCGAFVNHLAEDGWTPLLVAVEHGQIDVAKLLLEHGAHVNAKLETNQMTGLMISAQRNDKLMFDVLISKEAAINAKDSRNRSALVLAAGKGNSEIIKSLINYSSEACDDNVQPLGLTPLMFCAYNGQIEAMALLIEKGGAEINAKTADGFTALEMAALGNQKAAVDYLLARGAENRLNLDFIDIFNHFAKLFSKKQDIIDVLQN